MPAGAYLRRFCHNVTVSGLARLSQGSTFGHCCAASGAGNTAQPTLRHSSHDNKRFCIPQDFSGFICDGHIFQTKSCAAHAFEAHAGIVVGALPLACQVGGQIGLVMGIHLPPPLA